MKLKVESIGIGGTDAELKNVALSLTDTMCWGDYRIELDNEGKKQYARIFDRDGKLLSYSKNLDVLIRKVLLAEKLINELRVQSVFAAQRGEHRLSFDMGFPELWVNDNSFGVEFDGKLLEVLREIMKR